MTTYAWPTTRAYRPEMADFWLEGNDYSTKSVLGGGTQTGGVPGALWQCALTFPPENSTNRQQLLGYLRKLNGKEHRVQMFDLRKFGVANAWGYPAGTINTTGVTVKTTAAQFAISVVLTGCGVSKTLLAGDMLSINGQLIEVGTDTTSDGSGDLTLAVPERLRAQAAATTAVTLIQPTCLMVLKGSFHNVRNAALYDQMVVEFEEVLA